MTTKAKAKKLPSVPAAKRPALDFFDNARYRYDGLQFSMELFKLPGLQAQANAQNIVTVADVFTKYIMQEINVQPQPTEGQAQA